MDPVIQASLLKMRDPPVRYGKPPWYQECSEAEIGDGSGRFDLTAPPANPSLPNRLAFRENEGRCSSNRFDLENAIDNPTPDSGRIKSRPSTMLFCHRLRSLGYSKTYCRLKSCICQTKNVRFKIEMAKISRQDVEHVASLARLELSSEEKEKFTKQLSSVLEYFEKLDKAETADIKPINQINKMENVTTDDRIGQKWDRGEILKNTPEQEDGFIKVKAVFEENEPAQ